MSSFSSERQFPEPWISPRRKRCTTLCTTCSTAPPPHCESKPSGRCRVLHPPSRHPDSCPAQEYEEGETDEARFVKGLSVLSLPRSGHVSLMRPQIWTDSRWRCKVRAVPRRVRKRCSCASCLRSARIRDGPRDGSAGVFRL